MAASAYSFLPWLRTGIATRITTDPGTAARASIPVRLRISGEAVGANQGTIIRDVEQRLQIYGPGDVISVDPRAISRVEPGQWITNFEPNYLAHIEFYDEDFPWRYSPAAPDGTTRRLRPWLALVVLAAGADPPDDDTAEFTEAALPDRPLPFITVADPDHTLPPPDQLGAWAHVHVNGSLDGPVASNDLSSALPALANVLATNPDHACSRLICPRRLQPNTGYHAFLVPAFETGRLAGLGFDPAGSPSALHAAWGPNYPNRQGVGQLPYYHRWFFRTGSSGDFEFLVRLLEPGIPDPRVGRRDIDVHRSAGPGLPGIITPEGIGGVLRMGGALRIPQRPPDIFDTWDEPYPHPFQTALANLINLAEDYLQLPAAAANARLSEPAAQEIAAEVDPIITPPLYGRWPALTARLLTERDGTTPVPNNRNWVHKLNLDPRFRVSAQLGARVVQERQEEFMAAAWAQVGDVLAANARIRAAQLAREVGHVLQVKHLDPPATTARAATPSGRALALTAPAQSRVTTVAGGPGVAAFAAVEQIAVGFRVAESRVAAAPLSGAMRRITRPGSRLMRELPFTAEQPPEALLPRMDAETDPVTAAPPKTTPAAVVTPTQLDEILHPAPPGRLAAAADPVETLPTSPDFVITLPGDPFVPSEGDHDSPEALRFKDALRDLRRELDDAAVGGRVDPRGPLDVTGTTGSMLTGLRADQTVPRHLLSAVALPERLRPFAERFIEAMAYPVIDLPTYRALLDLSVDLFVPNLDLIPPNTVTLLATNQEFIESYLVGLNHEMAGELLWREYPTDQRGTPFRQFWDVRTALPQPGETTEQRRERLYDIKPIHAWPPTAKLGENDNRDTGGTQEEELVLVIRGELLKKYPNAAVYAQKADWQPGPGGQPDPTQEREPVDPADPLHPTHDEIRLPIYEATVEPDIHLLGFDLTAATAKGQPAPGDAGWFFVIKERPGDPRFGLDDGPSTRVEVWNDLSWPDVDPQGRGFIELDSDTPAVPLQEFDNPIEDQEKNDQHLEDLALPVWFAGLSSADIAYILFQAPVLMAVHAQEMLT